MTKQRREWLPSLVAGVVAAVTFAVVPGASVPSALIAITAGGDTRRIDVVGGLEVQFGYAPEADPAVLDQVASNLRQRVAARGVDGQVRRRPGRLVVEIPGVTDADRDRFDDLIATAGKLEFLLVEDGSAFMRQLYSLAERDPRAGELGVRAEIEKWRHDPTGGGFQDYYLRADRRETLESYLAEVARRDPEWVPDGDHALAIEEMAAGAERVVSARTYYVASRAVLDSLAIADAVVEHDPQWHQPIVMIRFTDDGGQRFGELTRNSLGRKLAISIDGRVMSAPIIQTEIWGGRAMITMGNGNAREMLRDAENTAGALRAGALPIPLDFQDLRYRPATVSTAALLAARGLFALAVGLLALIALRLGVWLGVGAPRSTGADFPIAVDRGRRWARLAELPWRRLAVTVAGLVGVVLAARVPIPLRLEVLGPPLPRPSAFALGLAPVLTAFLLVELAALVVPRWRPLRHGGPPGRARLGVATALVTLALAGFQGWMVATWQQSLGVAEVGYATAALTCVTLAAGVFVLVALAWLIDRYGLGNGYSVLLLAGLVGVGRDLATRIRQFEATPAQTLVGGVALAALVLATVWVLRSSRTGADRVGLRWPTSGIVPLVLASALFGLVETLGLMGVELPALYWRLQPYLVPTRPGTFLFDLFVVVVAALGCSWLFSRPALWWRARARLAGTAAVGPVSSAAGSSFLRGTLFAVGYLAVVSAIHFVTYWKIPTLFFPLPVILLSTAILIDLFAEWHAFAVHRDLVAVWPLHRVQLAEDAVAALAVAGIPAHLRAVHHRSMLHFFAPYVPISIMVPQPMAAAAHALLAARLGGVAEPPGTAPEEGR